MHTSHIYTGTYILTHVIKDHDDMLLKYEHTYTDCTCTYLVVLQRVVVLQVSVVYVRQLQRESSTLLLLILLLPWFVLYIIKQQH